MQHKEGLGSIEAADMWWVQLAAGCTRGGIGCEYAINVTPLPGGILLGAEIPFSVSGV
jgi:hypothetical protein